jgi:serine/threonine-protein kinase
MSLAPGTRLGPYEIATALGAGGMGEVYRAHDASLDRNVAIKILPDAFARDPDRLARFQREAKVLASLNHPQIAAIYGLERSDTGIALVMELVPGPTLADMIRGSSGLPVSDAIAIARQVAEALEAAHEQGIVHRDLKPANIKVTDDGAVKVLDFGLAKALGPSAATATAGGEISNSPTVTSPAMTGMGVILGTAAYMSPEQARGKPVDKRTDIWAFGCVVFEMLAGRAPFGGEDVTEVLASVVKSDPDWSLLPSSVPQHLVRLIRRCLEKDRRQRLRDIGDARFELDEIGGSSPAVVGAPAATRLAWRERLAWLAALIVATTAVGSAVWLSRPAVSVGAPVTRFTITLPEGQQFSVGAGYKHVAVSPDGRTIVYAANGQLYTRTLDASEPVPIAGSNESGYAPVFSPNGSSIAYYLSNPADAVPGAGHRQVASVSDGRTTAALVADRSRAVLRQHGQHVDRGAD